MPNLPKHVEDQLDELDATIFTGDSFYDPEALRKLEEYLERWKLEAGRIRRNLAEIDQDR